MLLIPNTDNRLEEFMILFEWLDKNNYGKLTSSHFIISTDTSVQVRNEMELIFDRIQRSSKAKGIPYNCFCLNVKS